MAMNYSAKRWTGLTSRRQIAACRHKARPGLIALLAICLLFCLTLAVMPSRAAETPSPEASVLEVAGSVEISPSGTTAWKPARKNQALNSGDRIRTGDYGAAPRRYPFPRPELKGSADGDHCRIHYRIDAVVTQYPAGRDLP